jgi:hypothetical protein
VDGGTGVSFEMARCDACSCCCSERGKTVIGGLINDRWVLIRRGVNRGIYATGCVIGRVRHRGFSHKTRDGPPTAGEPLNDSRGGRRPIGRIHRIGHGLPRARAHQDPGKIWYCASREPTCLFFDSHDQQPGLYSRVSMLTLSWRGSFSGARPMEWNSRWSLDAA